MFSNSSKTVISLGAMVMAFLFDLPVNLGFILGDINKIWCSEWLHSVGYFRWGWIFTCALALFAIITAVYWKINKVAKRITIVGAIFILFIDLLGVLMMFSIATMKS